MVPAHFASPHHFFSFSIKCALPLFTLLVCFSLYMQFTAVTGELSHGIAITIWEELSSDEYTGDFVRILREQRERRRACVVVIRTLRRFITRRREAATLISRTWKMHRANMASKLAQSLAKRGERPRYLKRHSDDSMGLTEAEIGSIRNARRRPSDVDAFRSSLDRRGSQKILSNVIGKWVSGMRNSTVLSADLDSDDSFSFSSTMLKLDDHDGKLQGSSTQDFCNWEGFDRGTVEKNRRQRKTLIQPVETNPVSDSVRRLAAESYQEMVKNDTYGDTCLVQKCYVMIGTRPAEQSLIFCALQQIVDLEREVSDKMQTHTVFTTL